MKLFYLCILCLTDFVVAQEGKHSGRRHRVIEDFFPGCLAFAENRTMFIECAEQRADERCFDAEEKINIATCMRETLGTLTEEGVFDGGAFLGQGGQGNAQVSRQGNGQGGGQGSQGGGGMGFQGGDGGVFQGGGGMGFQGGGGMGCQGQGCQGGSGQGGPRRVAVRNMVNNCTAGFRACARERLENDIANLPSCVPESMLNLTFCARDNREACRESCRGRNNTGFPRRGPYTIPAQRLKHCNGIRSQVFNHVCRSGECCGDCLPQLEEVGTCFINTVMQYLPQRCEINCEQVFTLEQFVNETEDLSEKDTMTDGSNRRNLEFDQLMHTSPSDAAAIERGWYTLQRALQEIEGGEIYNECIEIAPGLNKNRRDADELALRFNFFDCVVEKMRTFLEDDAVTEQNGTDNVVAENATDVAENGANEAVAENDPDSAAAGIGTDDAVTGNGSVAGNGTDHAVTNANADDNREESSGSSLRSIRRGCTIVGVGLVSGLWILA